MSILGVILRVQPEQRAAVLERLRGQPGTDIVADPGNGRLVLVLEDTGDATHATAAARLGAMATWPEVLNASLVYEYSGPDAPAPDLPVPAYQAWRGDLTAIGTAARPADAANA